MSRGRHAHKGSDTGMTGGTMHWRHIRPLSGKDQRELFNSTNLNNVRCYNENRSRMQNRAKALETMRNQRAQSEQNGPDFWFVLVDSHGKRQNGKVKAMSFSEARERNRSIHDLGLQWTRGEP